MNPRFVGRAGRCPANENRIRRASAFFLTGVLCEAALFLSCASQVPPQPPRVQHPERITDVKVKQVGETLLLSFTPPVLATDGERLTKPLEIKIFRSITPAGQRPQAMGTNLKLWLTLFSSQFPRYRQGARIVYPEHLSQQQFNQWLGATLTFAVQPLTRGFRHRPILGQQSNVARTVLLDVSGPVQNLVITPTQNALELHWSPPARTLTNHLPKDLSGYRLYRSTTGTPGSYELMARTVHASYKDSDFVFGQPYFYKVQAVFSSGGMMAESEHSMIADITPRDVFPPAAPSGLTALYARGVVDLVWNANTESDLAGYNVYRHEKNMPAHRINPVLLKTPIFRDSSVAPNQKYLYKVTAVDLSGNESGFSKEVAVETR